MVRGRVFVAGGQFYHVWVLRLGNQGHYASSGIDLRIGGSVRRLYCELSAVPVEV